MPGFSGGNCMKVHNFSSARIHILVPDARSMLAIVSLAGLSFAWGKGAGSIIADADFAGALDSGQ